MITKLCDFKNPFERGGDVYDFSALESLEEFRTLAENATIILAADKSGNGTAVVYGAETCRAIASRVIPEQVLYVVTIAIDFKSLEVEKLCAAVQVVKGFHEWQDKSK